MARLLKVANKIIFSRFVTAGWPFAHCRVGAAPLGRDLAQFLKASNAIDRSFGLTEAGILFFNPLERAKPGSIGVTLPGVEAR